MRKEITVGLLVVACLIMLFWGYNFLRGKDVLKKTFEIYVEYAQVDGLQIGSPVYVNGFQVGSVNNITIKDEDLQTLLVLISFDGPIKLPKETKAVLYSVSLLGDKAIKLAYDTVCTGDDCLQNQDYIQGTYAGILESMAPKSEIEEYTTLIQNSLMGAVDTLTGTLGVEEGDTKRIVNNLDATLANLNRSTLQLSQILANSASKLDNILAHLEGVTEMAAMEENSIRNSLHNIEIATANLAAIDANTTLTKVNSSVDELQATLEATKEIMESVNQGNGTLGKLTKDEELYTNLTETLKQLDFLLQDIRLNPKRYVNVSVFGKKGNQAYEVPESDPATNN